MLRFQPQTLRLKSLTQPCGWPPFETFCLNSGAEIRLLSAGKHFFVFSVTLGSQCVTGDVGAF